jgi:16S rRNA C967 or C1407 C5-methylase (RsmB/RsmF family)
MIPAALLAPEPHHIMLDLAASPRSKTTQLIEALHVQSSLPEGIVVANDVDPMRAYHLVRRCAALRAACSNLVVTCHPGQRFPNIQFPGHTKSAAGPDTLEQTMEGRYPPGVCDRYVSSLLYVCVCLQV